MTMIGIDPHKATHTAVAIDDGEGVIDLVTVPHRRVREDNRERLFKACVASSTS